MNKDEVLSDSIITFWLDKIDANKEASNIVLVTIEEEHGKKIAYPPTK